jgi:putative DNA primase/helicase
VKNGTVELSRDGTQRLREHRRDDLITKVAPVSYDASAECTRWLQFLHESFDGDADTIRYLQQLVGYSLIGTTFEKVIVFCVGGPDTGKTTLVETIAALFGYSDGYALKLAADFFLTKMYDKSEYDMAKLHGVRYAYASEADEGKRLAVARLKELSGNDRLRGRHPAGRPFDYTPSHTLWLATNHLPNVRGTDTAIWNRLRVIPFNAPVAKARQDPFLQEALTRELSGILNWALTGFSDMMAHGLVTPSAVTNATKQYETENDLVKEWFEEEIFVTNDAQDRMDASTLYMLYDNWCKARNETTMPKNGFGRALTKMGYESSKSGGRKAYKGLRFGAHQTATRPLNVMSN